MNSINKTAEVKDVKAILSTLWIFATLNYLYCDILGFFDAATLKGLLEGHAANIQITPGFLLGASVLMEIPISLVILSRVLNYGSNRWVNIVAGVIMTAVQISSLFIGSTPTNYYIFFSIIEVACTAYIVWYAWNWTKQEG